MGTPNARFDAADEQAVSRNEALALIAANLARLRGRAIHYGSHAVVSLLDAALVQACWDAGIGPREASDDAIAEWLSDLLGAVEKNHAAWDDDAIGRVVPITTGRLIAADR